MRTQPTAGDQLFKMMAFQYKPIEKAFKSFCKREGMTDLITKYNKLSSIQKIRVLDMHASHCGL